MACHCQPDCRIFKMSVCVQKAHLKSYNLCMEVVQCTHGLRLIDVVTEMFLMLSLWKWGASHRASRKVEVEGLSGIMLIVQFRTWLQGV